VGIKKIRLTGGEPLLHPDIAEIVKACSDASFNDIAMTTNALLLKDRALILRKNGLKRVNISLNSLDAGNYLKITGVDGLKRVLEGITAAEEAGLEPIKINVVLMRGKNDHEVRDFINLIREKSYQVRFRIYAHGSGY
jgi:cyclic pyranopterin phosphate synthase